MAREKSGNSILSQEIIGIIYMADIMRLKAETLGDTRVFVRICNNRDLFPSKRDQDTRYDRKMLFGQMICLGKCQGIKSNVCGNHGKEMVDLDFGRPQVKYELFHIYFTW